jgi:Ca-activated chloride channel family protein
MSHLEFKDPYFLLLLIPYAAMIFWYIFRKVYDRETAFGVSSEKLVKRRESFRSSTYRFLPILTFLAILMYILALSRPGRGIDFTSVKNQGIDIMITMDVSGSMSAEDFQPSNRLHVSKMVIKEFVTRRKHDRLGMVVFGGEAYLQCPLTVEHQMIQDIVDEVDLRTVSVQGTAIGDAIALSTARMIDSKAKSKIILLLTDGENNRGKIDPETAAKAAADNDIKIYCVGIGSNKPVTRKGPFGFTFTTPPRFGYNREELEKIAEITKGKFYQATDSGVLWEQIRDIDRLERTEIEMRIYHEFYDKFQWFLLAGTIFLFVEIILRSLVYRKIP